MVVSIISIKVINICICEQFNLIRKVNVKNCIKPPIPKRCCYSRRVAVQLMVGWENQAKFAENITPFVEGFLRITYFVYLAT